jgi:1,4-alpha-glucan branching enzyme
MTERSGWDWLHAPINIYEVHAGSWRRHPDGRAYTYAEMAESLIPYVIEMGFTHIELLPFPNIHWTNPGGTRLRVTLR